MEEKIYNELGLSPIWQFKRPPGSDAAAPPAINTAEKTPPKPVPPSAAIAGDISPISPIAPIAPAASNASPHVEKMTWHALQHYAANCTNCGLAKTRQSVVFADGNPAAPLMLVGEGPGAEEDRQGLPFVGEAGKLLDLMLHAINKNRREDVYITNIVKCRPPQNRNPSMEEAHACLPMLARQIALVKPRLIVALGKVAATHLLQTDTAIGALRQKMHAYRDGNIPVVVTYHPAYLLRSPGEKRKSWEDLKFIRRLLSE